MKSEKTHVKIETLESLVQYIDNESIELIDCCFTDPLGYWHHCTFATCSLSLHDYEMGFAFDGSSIPLFAKVECSDMIMKPDPTTCWIDPFHSCKVLHIVCDIEDPFGHAFPHCPRYIAKRAVEFMCSVGVADEIRFGPEAEFFLFDTVQYKCSSHQVFAKINSTQGYWNSAEPHVSDGTNLANRPGKQKGYFPVQPLDQHCDIRNEMLLTMAKVGLSIEKHHHEVATCQHELGIVYNSLVQSADSLMTYKYVVKNVAVRHQKTATFMPKPLSGNNGSGMHCHQSLWKNGKNIFFDINGDYMYLSEIALFYIGGILKHAPAVLAFSNATVNSYKRLVPGYEAPVNLIYSKGNRSAAIRIPLHDSENPNAKRIEFRCPDASGCVYLTYAAILLAGIDGILNRIHPPPPLDADASYIHSVHSGCAYQEPNAVTAIPTSLDEALCCLENDHAFLLHGNTFSKEFIDAYIAYKRNQCQVIQKIPHPKEFELYYNC